MDIKIIIATHKKYRMPGEGMYVPLQVGAQDKEDIGYLRDDSGNNISDKNDTYCELTGMYYAWQNMDADYIGLVHYRRYFASPKLTLNRDPFKRILKYNEAKNIFNRCDIIVPKKRNYYIESLYSHYDHTFDGKHLRITYRILADNYPEYIGAANRVYRRSWGYMFNMFIAPKEIWDSYCEWLFDILSMVESKIDVSHFDAFNARLFGRISEILFNVWLEYNSNLRIQELPCIHMEPVNWLKKGTAFLEAKFLGRGYSKSF